MTENEALTKKMENIAAKIWADQRQAIENLTQEQFTEVITQSLQSGDFMRHVLRDESKQGVSYIPYREKIELEGRIQKLEDIVGNVKTLLETCTPYIGGQDYFDQVRIGVSAAIFLLKDESEDID